MRSILIKLHIYYAFLTHLGEADKLIDVLRKEKNLSIFCKDKEETFQRLQILVLISWRILKYYHSPPDGEYPPQ